MSLRGLALMVIVFGALPMVLARPYVGLLMWMWLGFMYPHRLTFGFTYSFPFVQVVAIVTLVALAFSKESRRLPWSGLVVAWLMFWAWTLITTLQALNPEPAWEEFIRFSKIQIMIAVALVLLNTRERIDAAVAVVAASLFFYGVKGGLFTLLGGGDYLVWGPEDSFIAGNNELAFALVVVLPLAWYLFTAYASRYRWVRFGVPAAAALSLISILGSYSRGAFLAVAAMLFFLWVRGRRRMMIFGLAVLGGLTALAFMPAEWIDRMESIRTYAQDPSALGRLNSWRFAIELANAHPVTGGGARAFTPELFQQYAPDPENFHDAHSIYFEVLAEQGYVGLMLYLILGITALVTASRTAAIAKRRTELAWAGDLARFAQVSLIGYAVGGAFLGLAYFDLPYTVMAFIACTYGLARREEAQLRAGEVPVYGGAQSGMGGAADPAVPAVGKERAN